jgi:hypothetical protein
MGSGLVITHAAARGGDLVHLVSLVYLVCLVRLVGDETNQINQTNQINCLRIAPHLPQRSLPLQSDGYAIDFEVDSPSQFAETVWPINS